MCPDEGVANRGGGAVKGEAGCREGAVGGGESGGLGVIAEATDEKRPRMKLGAAGGSERAGGSKQPPLVADADTDAGAGAGAGGGGVGGRSGLPLPLPGQERNEELAGRSVAERVRHLEEALAEEHKSRITAELAASELRDELFASRARGLGGQHRDGGGGAAITSGDKARVLEGVGDAGVDAVPGQDVSVENLASTIHSVSDKRRGSSMLDAACLTCLRGSLVRYPVISTHSPWHASCSYSHLDLSLSLHHGPSRPPFARTSSARPPASLSRFCLKCR